MTSVSKAIEIYNDVKVSNRTISHDQPKKDTIPCQSQRAFNIQLVSRMSAQADGRG